MNLTREYILWRFGVVDRPKIISLVDAKILTLSEPSEDLINLSISSNLDDYDFVSRMAPFVDRSTITKKALLPLLLEAVSRISPDSASLLADGMMEFAYSEPWIHENDPSFDSLFYPLYHLTADLIPIGRATSSDVAALFSKWSRQFTP